MFRLCFVLCCCYILSSCAKIISPTDSDYTESIRLNQVGYYPNGPKKAVITAPSNSSSFQVFDVATMNKVYAGELTDELSWELAGEKVKIATFTALNQEGRFTLYIEGIGYSYPFEIKANMLQSALLGAIKSLYYQRVGMTLEEKHAGQWKRAAGHPDDKVAFHPSSGKTGYTSSPKGWYDAGDYGKYVVNGAFPLGQMLTLYEQYPDVVADGMLNIPESGNGVSDFLDELKYELDWLHTMQDEDGGLFFKLTTKRFGGMVLPELAVKPRFIIGKGTTSTLDFAAVAAKAARIYNDVDSIYAKSCLIAAEKAWNWAKNNPDVAYSNPEDIVTGEYGDKDFSQEFFWAAAELFASTKSEEYLQYLQQHPMDYQFKPGESWANFMHYLGAFTLIDQGEEASLIEPIKADILSTAQGLVEKTAKNDYFQPIDDFHWGSNSDVMNAAMIIAQAYRIDPRPAYLNAIQEITDYIFGKNATGYSFLTGFGTKRPMFIHHRPSAGDDIAEPVPGLLSGGPNSRKQDEKEVIYPKDAAPMQCWVDQEPSYASNEICLNWNSALIYVLGFLEQETSKLNQ